MNHRSDEGGFTLLELMLATVLTVLLMMGVMMVVATLYRSPAMAADDQRPAEDGTTDHAASIERWIDLFRDDLRHARTVAQAGEDVLRLVGPLGVDSGGRATTHRPVTVAYQLTERDGRTWLVREQAALDLPTNRHRQRDLVLAGVQRFALTRRVLPAADTEQEEAEMIARAVGEARSVERGALSDEPREADASADDELREADTRGDADAAQEADEDDGADGGAAADEAERSPQAARRRVAWYLRWTDGGGREHERFLLVRMEDRQ